MPRVAKKDRLTPFGRTVLGIALEHGLETRAALLRHLEEHGHHFSSERVGHWLYGRNQVDRTFPRALVEVFGLHRGMEQYDRLAVEYMAGQNPD